MKLEDIKIGMKVVCVKDFLCFNPQLLANNSLLIGKKYTIKNISGNGDWPICMVETTTSFHPDELEPEKFIQSLTLSTMSIIESFAQLVKSEPQKSFRKAGITNGEDLLTDEGIKVFLTWLLNRNADDFKNEVVTPLLVEMKENK